MNLPDSNDIPIQTRLRDVIHAKGWTVSKVAFESGLRRATISDILNNHTASPTAITLLRLALVLDTSVDYLVGTDLFIGHQPPQDECNGDGVQNPTIKAVCR